jgi:hypothetical protein
MMINWRGLLINLLPFDVTEAQGSALVAVLGGLTVCSLPLIWRGRWDPSAPRFAVQFMATIVVTLLASPHSHGHGATLLLVPAAVAAARHAGPRLLQRTLRLAIFVPVLVFAATRTAALANMSVTYLLLLMLGVTLVAEASDLLARRAGRSPASASPRAVPLPVPALPPLS